MSKSLLAVAIACIVFTACSQAVPPSQSGETAMQARTSSNASTDTRIEYYNVGSAANDEYGQTIYAAPDGNIYYSTQSAPNSGIPGNVGKLDPSTKTFTEITLPNDGYGQNFWQTPDGAIWITVNTATSTDVPSLTRLLPFNSSGMTQITMKPYGGYEYPSPMDVTQGSDGNIWFTLDAGALGKISPAGPYNTSAVKIYAVPGNHPSLWGITNNSDGDLWFTDSGNGNIDKSTTAGVMTTYPTPDRKAGDNSLPFNIRATDGRAYFDDLVPYEFESVGTGGSFTNIPAISQAHVQVSGAGLGRVVFYDSYNNINYGTGIYTVATKKIVALPSFDALNTPLEFPKSETVAADGSVWFILSGPFQSGAPLRIGHLILTPTWSVFPSRYVRVRYHA